MKEKRYSRRSPRLYVLEEVYGHFVVFPENEEEDVKGKDVDNDDDTQNATDIEEDADKEGENEEKDEGKEADEDRAATGYEKTDDAAENEKGQGDNTEPTAADENKPSPNDDENRMEVDPGNGTEEENTCPILKGVKIKTLNNSQKY